MAVKQEAAEGRRVVFGFLHEDIVDGLQAYGSWKTRQGAMDALMAAIREADFKQGSRIQTLQLLDFLLTLMDDPNFKIKQGSLETMQLLVKRIGAEIEYCLSDLVPKLVEKLSDPKDYVREGCTGIFRAIVETAGAVKLVLLLKHCMQTARSNTRGEIVRLYIMALLMSSNQDRDSGSLNEYLRTILAGALKESLLEQDSRVAAYAAEGLRVLYNTMEEGALWALLNDGKSIPAERLQLLRRRCEESDRSPYLNEKGCVVLPSSEIPEETPPIQQSSSLYSEISVKSQSSAISAKSDPRKVIQFQTDSTAEAVQLERRLSLRSYPIADADPFRRSSTEEDEADGTASSVGRFKETPQFSRAVEPATANKETLADELRSVDRRKPAAAADDHPRGSVKRPSTDHQTLFRRLFQSKPTFSSRPQSPCNQRHSLTPLPKKETAPSSAFPNDLALQRENSGNVAARIDRIAQLIRERDETRDSVNDTAPPSKSASLLNKKRENLDILKMKQKDRRTHSANAVLQRNSPDSPPGLTPRSQQRETLPSIHSKGSSRSTIPKHRPKRETPAFDEVTKPWQPARGVPKARSPLFEDVLDDESSGFVSSPGSVIHTRPGTLASGISTATRVMACDVTETEPFIDPDAVLESTIERLKRANNARKKEIDWVSQAEALNDARRLVYHHPTLVKKNKRNFVTAFVPALQQLRSTTAKTAILLCQDVFEALGDSLEHEVDDIVPLLLRKAGETSNAGRDTFLAAEADKALSVMIHNVQPSRALNALLANSGNASKYVRCKVAAHLDGCVELAASKLNADGNLTLIDRIFRSGVGFLEEGSQETRTYGKRILWGLKGWINNRGAFQRLMGQLETDTKKRRVRDVFDNAEGPPPLPNKHTRILTLRRTNGSNLTPLTPSLTPPGRVTHPGSYHGIHSPTDQSLMLTGTEIDFPSETYSPGASTRCEVQVCTVRRPPKPSDRRRYPARSPSVPSSDAPESLSEVMSNLTAKDWRVRIDALQQLESQTGRLRHLSDRELLNVMDQLTYRLNDGNSKVVLVTLETMRAVFEKTGKEAIPALNTVLPAVVANLASSSEKIRFAADGALDALISNVDSFHLVQNLSQCCAQSNPRTKAALLQKLEAVAASVHQRKPQTVLKYILPVAFASLSDIRLDVREANNDLMRHLAQLLGRSFIERAETLTGTNRQRLFEILQSSS